MYVVTNVPKGEVAYMESDVIITLLTITVSLLSLVIIGLLVVVIIVLIKVRQMTKKLNFVLENVGKATDWLSPVKLFAEARRAFHK
jgi:hypothetical protein